MAGNIIPAIATTNAVIAGLIVFQALQVLRSKASEGSKWAIASSSSPEGARSACLQIGKPSVPLGTYFLSTPNPSCGVCRDQYATMRCDPSRTTLGEILEGVLRAEQAHTDSHEKRDVSVYEGIRLLSDPDFDDNHDRSLESLHCTRGKFLTIVDEDGTYENVVLAICLLP
jgi:ubiquitin-like 1-activating enzyme E1 B